jgi:hypothetical protein
MSNQSLSPDPIPTHQTGRMSRVPGNRTPRRVQWASEVDSAADKDEAVGRRHENGLESDADSTRELDEAALDPGAFQTLTHALERHRSSSVSASPHSAVAAPPLQPRLSTSSSVESSSGPDSPKILSHNTNVPGEAFIEPGERAGLPMQRSGSKKDQFSDSEARAATVVRAHSVNPFSRRFFRRRTRPTPARPSKSENTDTEKAAAADATSPMTRAHGGILSALLALYDHDSDSASISSTLRTSSGRVTPEPHSHESPTHSFIDLASASGRRLADMSKSLHLPETRPSRERNAAGVFGSLIASTTGTLVGAAAPTHSAIAPDIKRPGYHLSRYSLDGGVPTAPQHPPPQRPRSVLANGGTQHQLSSSSSSFFQFPSHASPHGQQPHSAPSAHGTLAKLTETLRELPKRGRISHPGTSHTATDSEGGDEKEDLSTDTENDKRRDSAARRRDKNKRRRKAEIYITRHISSLISRQTFILKLARAMMMFGGPTHRLQAQMQSTARVLEISLSCMYLPDVMLVAFDDDVTSTSSVKLIRQSSALDLGKVQDAYKIYWRVCVHSRDRQEGD